MHLQIQVLLHFPSDNQWHPYTSPTSGSSVFNVDANTKSSTAPWPGWGNEDMITEAGIDQVRFTGAVYGDRFVTFQGPKTVTGPVTDGTTRTTWRKCGQDIPPPFQRQKCKDYTMKAQNPRSNERPVATSDPDVDHPDGAEDNYAVAAGETLRVGAPGVLANDPYATKAQLQSMDFAAAEWTWGHGDGSFTYTAGAGAVGQVKHFVYRPLLVDGFVAEPVTATITITEPVDRSDDYRVRAGERLIIGAPGVLANDRGATTAKLQSMDFAASEWSWGGGDGSFIYTAGPGAAGQVKHFTYIPVDPDGAQRPATNVTISIAEPVDRSDSYTVRAGERLIIGAPGILANDSGASVAQLESMDFAGSEWSWGGGNGSFTYVAGAGAAGQVKHFTYVPVDPDGFQHPATTVTINIAAPIDRSDYYAVNAGERIIIGAPGVLANDSGATTAALQSMDFAGSEWSWGGGNGSFTYVAGAGAAGQVKHFTYIPVDPDGFQHPATTVTVNIVAPVNRSDYYVVRAGQSLTVSAPGVLGNDGGASRAQLQSMDFAAREWTWGGGNGGFTYTAGAGAAGQVKHFTYIPVDPDGFQHPATTVTISISR
ncbi:MAG TPA: hypothetical protein VMZ22_01220 [Acidimicrobiales bacterium]|nr:hypothetical protein [Acidimicrobiales bacterium]